MWQARGGSAWTCVACDGASRLARRPCDGLLYATPWYLEFYTIISVRHARVRLGGALREGARRAGKSCSDIRARTRSRESSASYLDRKSTRLNSSHGYISYAVFCL